MFTNVLVIKYTSVIRNMARFIKLFNIYGDIKNYHYFVCIYIIYVIKPYKYQVINEIRVLNACYSLVFRNNCIKMQNYT